MRVRRPQSAFVVNAPNLLAAVVAHQEASVRQLHDRDRASPYVLRIGRDHPARQEIAYRSARLRVGERNKRDGLTYPFRTIPGAVKSYERAALIFLRKLLAGVKREVEHRNMRLQQHVAGRSEERR